MTRLVRPDEHDDPVAAVLSAHRSGARLALSTSGTTGATPRRVVRTTQSWWDSFPAYSELTGVAAGARVWAPGPLGSTMNLFAAVHAAWAGADVIDDPAQADHACLTPFGLERRGDELPRGTRVVVAGAHLPDRLAAAAQQRGLRIKCGGMSWKAPRKAIGSPCAVWRNPRRRPTRCWCAFERSR